MGYRYATAQLVGKDLAEAMKWFLKAAEQGYAMAEYQVGSMYLRGEGVAVDYVIGNQWTLKAAGKGVAGAQFNIGAIETLLEVRWRSGARYPYDVAPDGRILGATLVGQPTATPITLVVDWQSGLKR